MNGKGSARRPAHLSAQEWADRWAQTFGRPAPDALSSNGKTPDFGSGDKGSIPLGAVPPREEPT